MVFKDYESKEPWFIDPVPINPAWPTFFGLDYHPAKPYSALWAAVDPRSRTAYIIKELKDPRIKNIEDFANAVRRVEHEEQFLLTDGNQQFMGTIGEPDFRWIEPLANTEDRHWGSSLRRDLANMGIRCVPWDRASKDNRIEMGKVWFAQRPTGDPYVKVFKTCQAFDYELRHWYYDQKTLKPRKEHDDLIDVFLAFASKNIIRLAVIQAQEQEEVAMRTQWNTEPDVPKADSYSKGWKSY
jgi:hypothetical protein